MLALAHFFEIVPIEAETWYRVRPGHPWAGETAKAVARISLPHLPGHEIVLQDERGALETFSPSMLASASPPASPMAGAAIASTVDASVPQPCVVL